MKPDCPACHEGDCYHLEPPSRELSWSLGDDYDCDTCGFTWNEATFDPDFYDDNKWEFHYRVGCYGGDYVSYDSEDRDAKVAEILGYLKGYPEWSKEYEVQVLKLIKEADDNRMRPPARFRDISNGE